MNYLFAFVILSSLVLIVRIIADQAERTQAAGQLRLVEADIVNIELRQTYDKSVELENERQFLLQEKRRLLTLLRGSEPEDQEIETALRLTS